MFPNSRLSLSGNWRCRLTGARDVSAHLPGSLAVQHIGDEVTPETPWTGTIFNRVSFESPDYAPYREPGNLKLPFWLQPEKVYVGEAVYEREIDIPAAWTGKRVVLTLEHPHWFTRVWLDDQEIGAGDSLSIPHRFELGNSLTAGTHRLTIRIDNRIHIAVGENAHSVSDHTQGNWNGIIGRIELSAHEATWFDDVQVHPNVAALSVLISGQIGGATTGCTVSIAVGSAPVVSVTVKPDGSFSAEYPLGPDAALWSEFDPALHTLTATLVCGSSLVESRTVRFGLREISTAGTQFHLNSRPIFLRGTLECCIFPLTGHPPMDVESWRRVLQVVKDHGLNHVRFHSWCPPEAAFAAGDELGLYFQVEVATWPNSVAVEAGKSRAGIGDGNTVDAWIYDETARILREYGNHACFVFLAAGNEPGGPRHAEFLNTWVAHCRGLDARRLYTGAAGWPELPDNQFHVIPEPRGHQWLDGLKSRMNALPPSTAVDYRESIVKRTVPLVSHEIGQWCSYPPLRDAEKYTGHLKPRNYEIFAASLAANGMAGQLDDFVSASGKLQTLCYREEIEAALRTPGMGGFQLLDLRDFPGQGTATVGVLNAFWESKGYVTAEQFRRFCAPTVLLARLPKRVFTAGETFRAQIDIAHFGTAELENASVSWRLVADDGTTLGCGSLSAPRIPFGSGIPLGEFSVDLTAVAGPIRANLIVELAGTSISNDWAVWIYPRVIDATPAPDIAVVSRLTAEAQAILQQGGKVLLTLPARSPDQPADIELGFTPIFWNTWCTKGQAPHTLGILCDPAHPALAAFTSTSHTDWNWWYPLHRATPLILDGLPRALRPIVQVIDDWYTNRRLGLVIECKVGRGRLLLCGMDVTKDDPVSRQLLASLLRYMRDSAFAPSTTLEVSQVKGLSNRLTA